MYLASKRNFVGTVPDLSDTANLTFTTCLVLQTTTCTFLCLSARINPILNLMYFPYAIQSTCQRSEPACSCSSFRTGWTWVGVGSTWYVVPYPPLSLLTLTPLSSRGVLLVLQSPFILTRSAAETVLHPRLVSDSLASRFKLNKASDTTSDSSQICRVLTQMPHKLTHYITPRPLLKPNSPDSISSDCFLGEECIGIRSCSAVVEQLQRAKATQDSVKRNEIIQAVRDKVKIFLDSEDLKL